MNLFRYSVAFLAFAFLGACAITPAPSGAAAARASASELQSDYKLGVADKVRVIVFNEPTLSGEFAVKSDGKLSLPLIGDVVAVDRSVDEIRAEVQNRLAAGYLVNPNVSMEILAFRPFYILGEVNKPGEYPYSVGLTVLNAVAKSEGFTYRADKTHVFIKRRGEDQEHRVDLSSSTIVQPGDTIRIGERYF